MRDKNLLQLFLGLNVALATCFVAYLFISANNHPKVTIGNSPTATGTNQASSKAPGSSVTNTAKGSVPTGQTAVVTASTNESGITNAAVTAPLALLNPQRKIGWQQMESDERNKTNEYDLFLQSLRGVGLPEEKVRYVVLSDINELFSKKRLKEAVTHDIQWWRSEPEISVANALQEKGRTLEEERRMLIEKYLGGEAAELEKGEAMLWSNVQLTGPVLGNLPPEVHNTVQEICGRSLERSQGAFWARVNDGQPMNNVDMARLREQTRSDLRKVLGAEAMEEFLLRYSHNGHQLRQELRGFDPTPDEFRKILRSTDALDHQMQLEYGGLEALSPQQRERHLAQRDGAIREALGPKRYQDYLLVKDPLFRQAQAMAMSYGAPAKAIMPLYQMTKNSEGKRQKVLNDAALTPQQKSEAINAINQEQQRNVQQIVTEARNTR